MGVRMAWKMVDMLVRIWDVCLVGELEYLWVLSEARQLVKLTIDEMVDLMVKLMAD